MELKEFDYVLPKPLIAQKPVKPRDHSRLLVLEKKTGKIEHKYFYNIIDYLHAGDVLVLNNSKVFPARLIGRKKQTGGKIEVFLLHHDRDKIWQCLVGGRGVKVGLEIEFAKNFFAGIIANNNDGTWEVEFNLAGKPMMKIVERIGRVPLPPYIKRAHVQKEDKLNYQTVFAERIGSVAAPTAGLHFTSSLLKRIKAKGIKVEHVTLHVGLGTFSPVKEEDITKHKMHSEYVEIKKNVILEIIKAKKEKRRIITVGTTSARTLESLLGNFLKLENIDSERRITDKKGWTDIFIYPGYEFKVVDALITNFHLPKSSLLMLVSALAGKRNIDKAYKEAIANNYRFFSYGDAMFIK